MLSREDRRRLAAIGRQLLPDDPRLARRLAGCPAPSSVSGRSAVAVLGVLCAVEVVASLVSASVLVCVHLPVGMIISPWVVRALTSRRRDDHYGGRAG